MMSKKLKSFLKRSKDGNKQSLFQGSSSSLSRHQVLMSVVQVENPGCVVALMEVII
jgi:hypothetical protein